jgi:transcriptional regulator with XRE-family HTH domain
VVRVAVQLLVRLVKSVRIKIRILDELMGRRSLQASEQGIRFIRTGLKQKKWSQTYLAGVTNCSRQTIWSLLQGNPIDCDVFMDICRQLALDWEEIALPEVSEREHNANPVDTLVQTTRRQLEASIRERCGKMRVLDMTQPIALTGDHGIYTDVNILEKILGRRRLEIDELLNQSDVDEDLDEFDRFGLSRITEKRVPGLEAVKRFPKLMVLGKPGAGKTTFLKYLAMQCIEGDFQANQVPIFVTLKDFAEAPNEPSLIEFITQQFVKHDVTATHLQELLRHGRVLILLDGLDEVRDEHSKRVLKQIENFYECFFFSEEFKLDQANFLKERKEKVGEKRKELKKKAEEIGRDSKQIGPEDSSDIPGYPDISKYSDQGLRFLYEKHHEKNYVNQYVITCRIAAKEYTFEQFTEVEVADFDEEQIETFVRNWFRCKKINNSENSAEKLLTKLREFPPIKELANNPLLLTLLCLEFEEFFEFPTNRSELYERGLRVILNKWDASRRIERDQAYRQLPVKRKEDLLSQVALKTFEQKEYFFKQRIVEKYIADYIRHLPDSQTDQAGLLVDSEAILKSIEAQHGLLMERAKGIYSFSHLTFQEYFVAREIMVNSTFDTLLPHLTERRWREVTLLIVGMLSNADNFVQAIKLQIDSIVASDLGLQQLLEWAHKKTISTSLPCKSSAIRAFYIYLARDFVLSSKGINNVREQASNLAESLGFVRGRSSNKAFSLDRIATKALEHAFSLALDRGHTLRYDINSTRNHTSKLRESLNNMATVNKVFQELKDQIPDLETDRGSFYKWWKSNGKVWVEQLQLSIIQAFDVGHGWQLVSEQIEKLEAYLYANKLLIECLNSDCYISREVRNAIEDKLLLPIEEIENKPKPESTEMKLNAV